MIVHHHRLLHPLQVVQAVKTRTKYLFCVNLYSVLEVCLFVSLAYTVDSVFATFHEICFNPLLYLI